MNNNKAVWAQLWAKMLKRYCFTPTPGTLDEYWEDLRVYPASILAEACAMARAASPTRLPPSPLIVEQCQAIVRRQRNERDARLALSPHSPSEAQRAADTITLNALTWLFSADVPGAEITCCETPDELRALAAQYGWKPPGGTV